MALVLTCYIVDVVKYLDTLLVLIHAVCQLSFTLNVFGKLFLPLVVWLFELHQVIHGLSYQINRNSDYLITSS
jgi:hypothetical protein